MPIGYQPFLETFDNPPFIEISPLSGQWSVVNDTYRNNAVQQTNMAFLPFNTGSTSGSRTVEYTFAYAHAQPVCRSGNLVGIVFDHGAAQPYVGSRVLAHRHCQDDWSDDGVRSTLATANYSGGSHKYRSRSAREDPTSCRFSSTAYRSSGMSPKRTEDLRSGGVGLITHWAPVVSTTFSSSAASFVRAH